MIKQITGDFNNAKFLLGSIVVLVILLVFPVSPLVQPGVLEQDSELKIHSVSKPVTGWTQIYNISDHDSFYSAIQTADGGFMLAGSTEVEGNTSSWMVKTSADGSLTWSKMFVVESFITNYRSIIQTTDGGYAAAGVQDNNYGTHTLVVKTSSSGNVEWNRSYGGYEGGSNWNSARDIIQTANNGFLIIVYDSGAEFTWVIKTDSSGNHVWNRSYGEPGCLLMQQFESAHQTVDGGYLLAGRVDTSIEYNMNTPCLLKINATGHGEWNRTYGEEYPAADLFAITPTADGGYVFAGRIKTTDQAPQYTNTWLVKVDANGTEEWEMVAGSSNMVFPSGPGDVIQTADGGYFLCGGLWDMNVDPKRNSALVVRVDSTGKLLWNCTFDYLNSTCSIMEVAGGEFVVAGTLNLGGYRSGVLFRITDDIPVVIAHDILPTVYSDDDTVFTITVTDPDDDFYTVDIHWYHTGTGATGMISSLEYSTITHGREYLLRFNSGEWNTGMYNLTITITGFQPLNPIHLQITVMDGSASTSSNSSNSSNNSSETTTTSNDVSGFLVLSPVLSVSLLVILFNRKPKV